MAEPRPFAFPRARRLKRRRLIRPLFDRKRSDVHRIAQGSVHVLYRFAPSEDVGVETPFQVGFFPGRAARTNAGRVRLRRLLREAFRPCQPALLRALGNRDDVLIFVLLYRGREPHSDALRRDVPRALARLGERVEAEREG